MRAFQARYGASRTAHREHVCCNAGRLFGLPVDVMTHDRSVIHLRVEVLGEAEGAARMDIGYGVAGCIRPRIDRMIIGSLPAAVCVLPPDCRCILGVYHHGIRGGAWEPAVAPDAGVRVHTLPCVLL